MNVERIKEIEKSLEIGDREQFILRTIGYFYHDKYEKELNKAREYLSHLGIHKVVCEDDCIYICLERPGLLIGVKGENIEALEKYLIENDIKERIRIVEVTRPPMDFLTSWEYRYMDWDDL